MPENSENRSFETRLDAQAREAKAQFHAMLTQRFDWASKKTNDFAEAAVTRLESLYTQKTEELAAAVKAAKSLEIQQDGETRAVRERYLLRRHELALAAIKDRFDLMLKLSTQDPRKRSADETVSTGEELENLGSNIAQITAMDPVDIFLGTLDAEWKAELEGALNRTFKGDVYPILDKLERGEALEEKDWGVVLKYLSNWEGDIIHRNARKALLQNLPPKECTELTRRILRNQDFPQKDEIIVSMLTLGYLTKVQVMAIIDEEIKKDPERGEAKRGGDLAVLKAKVENPQVQKAQDAVREKREEAIEFKGSRQLGHINHARGWLSLGGALKAGSAAVGYTTIFFNVGMGIMEPLGLVSNPAIWAGMAEVAVGRPEWTKRKIASLVKDKNEEKDDAIIEKFANFEEELNNYDKESLFYATYAEKIVAAYKQKKRENMDPKVRLTLNDLGIQNEEALPESLQELFEGDKKARLEEKISDWAYRFASKTKSGMDITEAQGQTDFIAGAREKLGLTLVTPEIPNPNP